MIERVGASDYADAAVLDLSEGQRMRLLQSFAREGVGILITAADAHGAVGCTRLLSLSGGKLIEALPGTDAPVPADPGDVVPFRARGQGGGSGGA